VPKSSHLLQQVVTLTLREFGEKPVPAAEDKSVSILLSCFRGDGLIEDYMQSILGDSVRQVAKLIAIDFPFSHKNADYVKAQLHRYPDLVYVAKNEKVSLYDAWNEAARLADTEFLSNLNLDDRSTADYYEYGIQQLRDCDADVFSCYSVATSIIGKRHLGDRIQQHIDRNRFGEREVIEYHIDDMVYFQDGRIFKSNVPHCAPIWRSSLHDSLGYFDSRSFDFCADFEFWLRAMNHGKRFILSKKEMVLFYCATGTASDRLQHPENFAIIERWRSTFPPPRYRPSHLGEEHDLLHHCLNLNAIFDCEKSYRHLVAEPGFEKYCSLESSAIQTMLKEDEGIEQNVKSNLVNGQDVSLSVIMPAFNAARFIETAIRSVLNQEFGDLELIVVDDHSTDDTKNVVRRLAEKDGRIKLYDNPAKGVSSARNVGIEAASGKYTSFLDADDSYLAGSVSARIKYLEENKNVELVHGPAEFVDENDVYLGFTLQRVRSVTFDDIASNPAHLNTLMGRASLIKQFRFEADVQNGEDWWFFARILRSGVRSDFVKKGAATYRIHAGSTVVANMEKHESNLRSVIDWIFSPDIGRNVARRFSAGLSLRERQYVVAQRAINVLIWKVLSEDVLGARNTLKKFGSKQMERVPKSALVGSTVVAGIRRFQVHKEDLGKIAFRSRKGIADTISAINLGQRFAALSKVLFSLFDLEQFSGRDARIWGKAKDVPGIAAIQEALFYSYDSFAEWVKTKNRTLFRIGQFAMWSLRFLKRHSTASAVGAVILCALVLTPILIPQLAPYGSFFWTAAVLLMLSALSLLGVLFGNTKMLEFAERDRWYSQALRGEMLRELKKMEDGLKVRMEEHAQQQAELADRLTAQAQAQDALSTAVDALRVQGEKVAQSQEQLLARVEEHRQ
jgi:glycosyltransferase involved in cell wall biosynthesis